MPYKVIDGDLLNTQAKYICHQVNCKGRMGSGVAKQIRAKYPEVYTAYVKEANIDMLGIPQFVEYSARDCAPQPLKLSIHSGGIEHPCRCR